MVSEINPSTNQPTTALPYQLIEQIEADPEHKLPEGVTALIKHAVVFNGKIITGTIWYDKHKRFTDGYAINTSRIVKKEPGGIFVTQSGSRYLVELVDAGQYEVEFNG